MSADKRHLWENPDGSTNVASFLAAYERDDNIYWLASPGHIQNVLDELIGRASRAEQEPTP